MAQIKIKQGVIYDTCKREGISRAEFARRLGVSEATAFRIDEGRTDPGVKFIAALMITTGKPFETFFDIVDEPGDKAVA